MYVYGRAGTEKRAFRKLQKRMVGLEEAHVIMWIAEDFNGYVGLAVMGEEESIGGFGLGKKESRGLRAGKFGY